MTIKEQVLKETDIYWITIKHDYPEKVIAKKDFDEVNPEYLKWLNRMKEIFNELRKETIDLTIRKIKEQILNWMDKHRKEAVITCDEGCFCWDIEALLSKEENSKRKRRRKNEYERRN